MSERITPAMVTSATLNDLNSSLAALTRTTDELSSGKTILEPSDNPYGASQVIDLQSQLDGLSSYESNAQDGISWENTASSAMANMSEVTSACANCWCRAPTAPTTRATSKRWRCRWNS